MKRKACIIIHGTGSTLRDTLRILSSISSIKAHWSEGIFYTDKKTGLLLRKILSDADDDSLLFQSFRKMIVSRLLRACENPGAPSSPQNFSTFDEASIIDRFPDFDIPYCPESRRRAVHRLEIEGEKEFISIFKAQSGSVKENFDSVLSVVLSSLFDSDGSALTEEDAFAKIAELAGGGEYGKKIASDLVQLRDMSESGADLDTISSATFYAYALSKAAESKSKRFLYGYDYEFVFINYHQGLLNILEEFPEPGDIYMADIPISTIPDLPGDLKILHEKNYRLKRYEDHHPYTEEQFQMLNKLKNDGLIEFFAMSGPLQGEELPPEALKCGGDMVYENLIAANGWKNEAMAYLKKCVHGEDLAQERTEEGILLTELIKGGTNSIEIIQTLLSSNTADDIKNKLEAKGWDAKIAKERQEIAKIEHKFNEALQVIEIQRPAQEEGISGNAMGYGSDMPSPRNTEKKDHLKILVALAPYTSKKEPKLKIGKAQEYFAKNIPDADYLLFCYGSSLIVGRRLNQADFSINLSVLMRKIGTENDGGHSGAAVCGPDKNPNFPKSILGRVDKGNFKLYCRYLEKHIAQDLNLKVISRKDISIQTLSKAHKTGIYKLLALAASTLIIGSVVLFLKSDYRPAKIAELNKRDFFAWFGKGQNFSSAESDDTENSPETERTNTQ